MAFQPALGTLIGQLAWRAMGIIPYYRIKLKYVLTELALPLAAFVGN